MQGGGAALARRLARAGVRTRADLLKPAVFARLPRDVQINVKYRPARRTPLVEAQAIAAELRRRLQIGGRRVRSTVAGSVRRGEAFSSDLDILVVSEEPFAAPTLAPAARGDRLSIAEVYLAGGRRVSLMLSVMQFDVKSGTQPGTQLGAQPTVKPGAKPATKKYIRTDLFRTTPSERPYALFQYNSGRVYNIRVRAHAARKGWRLNQYGLFEAGTARAVRGSAAVRTERDVARLLGVTPRAPEDRVR